MSKGWKNAFVRFVHRSRSSSPPSSSSASPNLPPSSDAQPDAAEASHTSPASSPQVAVATSPAAPAPAPTAAAPPSSAPSRHSQETKHMLNIAKLDMLRHDPDIVGTPTRRTSAEVVATASPKTPPTRHSPSALLSKQPGLMAINECVYLWMIGNVNRDVCCNDLAAVFVSSIVLVNVDISLVLRPLISLRCQVVGCPGRFLRSPYPHN